MSIRSEALKWYEAKYGRIDIPIYTSKFYQPDESWPKKSVWWPQIPLNAIEKKSFINILCEVAPNSNDFYHLKVPTKFLREHLKKFHSIGGRKIDFYLSTDSQKLFIEERGEGNLNFKDFLLDSLCYKL